VGEVLAHDGREVHLGIGDPHRLDLDVPVLHQQLDRLAGDDGNHLGIKPHKPSWITWRPCPRGLTAGAACGSPRYTSPGAPRRNEIRRFFSGSSAGGRSSLESPGGAPLAPSIDVAPRPGVDLAAIRVVLASALRISACEVGSCPPSPA